MYVALDRLQRLAGLGAVEAPGAQHMDPADDRVERIAQFMRYGRQEFLFQPAGSLSFLQRMMLRIDVGGGDDPAGELARFVMLRHAAHQEPSIGAVAAAPNPDLDLCGSLKAGGALPLCFEHLEIVGMDILKQAFRADRRDRQPDVVAGPFVPVVESLIGARDPYELRQRVHQGAEAQLAPPLERLAIALAQ